MKITNKQIVDEYAARKQTIREIANNMGHSYEAIRRILVTSGYSNSKKNPLVHEAKCGMTDQEIIDIYAGRQQTIREIAEVMNLSYASVRKVMVTAGYSNGKLS